MFCGSYMLAIRFGVVAGCFCAVRDLAVRFVNRSVCYLLTVEFGLFISCVVYFYRVVASGISAE